MSEQGEIRARILASPVVTAMVADRVFAGPVLPLDNTMPTTASLPAVNFWQVSRTTNPTHDGGDLSRCRWQFNCWANTYNGSVALARAVEVALRGFHGAIPIGGADLEDPDITPTRYYRVLEMSIWATDPVPA